MAHNKPNDYINCNKPNLHKQIFTAKASQQSVRSNMLNKVSVRLGTWRRRRRRGQVNAELVISINKPQKG